MFAFLGSGFCHAATPLLSFDVSPDIDLVLSGGGGSPSDADSVRFQSIGGIPGTIQFPGIHVTADVTALDLNDDESLLLAFDTSVVLPGTPTSFLLRAGSIATLSGSLYSLAFDAPAAGIGPRVRVDAVCADAGGLLMSFDTSVDLGSFVANDEDLVHWNGSTFSMRLDGSELGVDIRLDLDAADYISSRDTYVLSFDGSGSVGGVAFDDEDLLEYDPVGSSWERIADLATTDPMWMVANSDAVSVRADPDLDGLWDGAEAILGTDPLDADSDDDGLSDLVETNTGSFVDATDTGTDPLVADTDMDGFSDGNEVAAGSDPVDALSTPAPPVPALETLSARILALILVAFVVFFARRIEREASRLR